MTAEQRINNGYYKNENTEFRCFLLYCQKDTLALIYNDELNNDVLINSGVEQVRKLVKADKNGVYSFGFYEKDSLPGDCHVATLLAMTQYFVRNGTVFCLLKSNSTFNIRSLCYSVQRTFCHCEERSDVAISRKGNRIVMTECVAERHI